MTRELKPLSELVNDVKKNDVVQFFQTKHRSGEKLKELKEPKKAYVGYYEGRAPCCNGVDFSMSPNKDTDFTIILANGPQDAYGGVYERPGCFHSGIDVSHYVVLQREGQGEVQ